MTNVLPPPGPPQNTHETSTMQRVEAVVRHADHALDLAYSGLAATVVEFRLGRADKRLESSNSEVSFHEEMTATAFGEPLDRDPIVAGEPEGKRHSRSERRYAKRVQAKAEKHHLADLDALLVTKTFKAHPRTGVNKRERRGLVRQVKQQARRGEILAPEAQSRIREIKARPVRMGEKITHQRTKKFAKARGKLDKTLDQIDPTRRIQKTERFIAKHQPRREAFVGHYERLSGVVAEERREKQRVKADGQLVRQKVVRKTKGYVSRTAARIKRR